MNGPQHFAEAQQLLDQAVIPAKDRSVPGWLTADELIARAQVHATLAVAAASLFPYHDEKEGEPEWKEWRDAMTAG